MVALVFGVYGVFIDSTIERSTNTANEEKNKRKSALPRLTRNGKIALAGVFIGGMISLVIKIATGIKTHNEAREKIAQQIRINDSLQVVQDSLRKEYKKDQAFKQVVDSNLNSTLESLKAITENTNDITNKQSENLLLQQVQIYNTQKILSPLNPLTLSLIFVAAADNPFVEKYYQRIALIKDQLEQRKPVDREGLIVSMDRGYHVHYIQVRSPNNSYFPNYDDDHSLATAVLDGGESINLTAKWTEAVNTYKDEGFLIEVPTALEDSGHQVGYIITFYNNSGRNINIKDSIEFNITCDINDKSLVTSFPGAPAFQSIYDLREKYISVRGHFTGRVELKKIVLQSGPDKRVTDLYFSDKDKQHGGYFGREKYYQRKIRSSEIR